MLELSLEIATVGINGLNKIIMTLECNISGILDEEASYQNLENLSNNIYMYICIFIGYQ